jgi:hypothetical protein
MFYLLRRDGNFDENDGTVASTRSRKNSGDSGVSHS